MSSKMKSVSKKDVVTALRRGREETTIRLRKNKKEQMLKARRLASDMSMNYTLTNDTAMTIDESTQQPSMEEDIYILKKAREVMVASQDNTTLVLEAVRSVRRLLCRPKHPPVDLVVQMVKMDIVPHLVRFLSMTKHADIVFEAEWTLTNITDTKLASVVVKQPGAVHCLAKNLGHEDTSVSLQAAWCLGNIAGDKPEYREGLLQMPEVVYGLIANLENYRSVEHMRNVAWAMSSLCRSSRDFGSIQPFIRPLINALSRLDLACDDERSKADKLSIDFIWAISYVAEHDVGIQALIDAGAVPLLVRIVARAPLKALLLPTVRAIGSLTRGTDEQTQHILNAGYLRHMLSLLNYNSKQIQKDACWTLSNIAAGSVEQVQMIFDQERYCGVFKKVVDMALNASHEVKKEAAYALCNVVERGNDKQIRLLIEVNQAMEVFVDVLLPRTDIALLTQVLKTLDTLFHNNIKYLGRFADREGLHLLEDLQSHPNNEIYEMAVGLLDKYCVSKDDAPDQNIAPECNTNGFSFGISKTLFPDSPVTYSFGVSKENY
ncbi:hypothetical protein MPSEU_000184100 [Mayamaea pseudoterrestris]|nr:hypothetical protein MPSEU_000184100 [Mayamaea pseudoterrestris]